nr:hypothetical protein HK105_007534 [Polyrhizophydium stewartii]
MPPVGARLRALAAAVSLSEVSGALGDMGTLLPILVSLGRTGQVSVTASLVFGGLFNIATGLLYDIPMCVQPMKAIAATALASNLSRAQIVSAGMCVSAVALLLGVTGLIKVVNAYIPMTIVRGIQLGAGLTLIVKGCQSVLKANLYSFAGFDYMDNFLVAALAFLLVLVCYRARSINPAALTLFATGVVLAVVRMYVHNDPKPSISIGFPAPTAPSAADFLSGFLSAGLGQLPLTLLNSVIAVAKLADDLFPDRPSPVASVTSIATFVGLLNLVGGWFGSTPYCHGAGGLAAQYRFGARSGASVVLLGLVKIVVGLLFGSTLVYVFQLIPNTIIGVMLAVAGIELAACARDLASHSTPADYEDHFVVMIVTAGGLIGFSNDGIGFCLGCVAALVLRLARWHRSKAGEPLPS